MRIAKKSRLALGFACTLIGCDGGAMGVSAMPTAGNTGPADSGAIPSTGSVGAGAGTGVTSQPMMSDPGRFTLAGSGFIAQAKARVGVALFDSTGAAVKTDSPLEAVVDGAGNISASWPNLLQADEEYSLAFYVDANRNGFCNAPPTDPSYRVKFKALAGQTVVTVPYQTAMMPACSQFGQYDFVFDSNLGLSEGHPGHYVYGVVNDASDNSQVGEIRYAMVQKTPKNGQAAFTWPNLLLNGHTYTFAICVDDNQNGRCDPKTGTDHQFFWTENGNSARGIDGPVNETFVLHHETNRLVTPYWPTVPSVLPITEPKEPVVPTVLATAGLVDPNTLPAAAAPARYTAVFDANAALNEHNNHLCFATVVDVTNPNAWVRVGDVQNQMVTGGLLKLTWPNVLERDHAYIIASFSDNGNDRTCTGTAGSEPQWVLPLPFNNADATAYFAHQSRVASCLYFPKGPQP